MWRFYFGIYVQEKKEEIDISIVTQHLLKIQEFGDSDDTLLFWHCAFEARNEVITNAVIKLVLNQSGKIRNDEDTNTVEFGYLNTAHDCAAIIYVIANIKGCNSMKLNFGNSGVRQSQITTLADVLESKCGSVLVNELKLNGNKLTDKLV